MEKRQKNKGFFGEEWKISKPKEVVTRTLPMTRVETHKAAPEKEDPVEKLKNLKELADAGVISQEEYEEKRKQYMDLI